MLYEVITRLLLNPDRPDGRELASKTVECKLRRGDVISMWTQGGGGYGPPAKRDRAAIEQDLREQKITPEAARSAYGHE